MGRVRAFGAGTSLPLGLSPKSLGESMSDLVFRPGARVDVDEWSSDVERISEPKNLIRIEETIDRDGPILVQHKFLRGARGPQALAFDDFEVFIEYLRNNARAGDKITVWSLASFMKDATPIVSGKCPDRDGMAPRKGSY